MEHLDEFVAQNEETSYLKPFLAHFSKVCLAIEHEIAQQQILPGSDRHLAELQAKYDIRRAKRAQNFEKFRKETKMLVRTHYQLKLDEQQKHL